MPQSVASTDTGNHMVFAVDAGIADAIVGAESGVVHAISVRGPVPAAAFSMAFPVSENDVAFAFGATRVYNIGSNRMLVRSSDGVIAGDTATLVQMHVLGPRVNDPLPEAYRAPKLVHGHAGDGTGERTTIVRIDIDRDGIVRAVTPIVPSSDAGFDASLGALYSDDRYAPATLAGKPIGGSVFREIRH